MFGMRTNVVCTTHTSMSIHQRESRPLSSPLRLYILQGGIHSAANMERTACILAIATLLLPLMLPSIRANWQLEMTDEFRSCVRGKDDANECRLYHSHIYVNLPKRITTFEFASTFSYLAVRHPIYGEHGAHGLHPCDFDSSTRSYAINPSQLAARSDRRVSQLCARQGRRQRSHP